MEVSLPNMEIRCKYMEALCSHVEMPPYMEVVSN